MIQPSFWLLFAMNMYCIYYYQQHPEAFKTIVWIYWIQSVLIGLFNFLYLLTLKNVVPGSWGIQRGEGKTVQQTPLQSAIFFLLHYGVFHLVYMIFLFAMVKEGSVDMLFILISAAAFSLSLVVDFIRKKIQEQTSAVDVNIAFFLPYVRIIPMHLMFFVPVFLGWKMSSAFLVLKTIADIAMYVLTNYIEQQKNPVSK